MNIKVIAACLACTALSLSACSSSVNCSECGKALDVSADTYVMQSGSPFCGDCAARDEIAAGVCAGSIVSIVLLTASCVSGGKL